ncbi:ABC transporter ATP-binding protein [Devosia ginsengisoli]|nr:ABC transporter ATP-binding protein [Devosia ginsengisoli]
MATAALAMDQSLALSVRDLKTHFVFRNSTARSVDGVSIDVPDNRTVAVVGESGSGKSVTSLSIMRLLAAPGRIVGGEILYRDRAGTVTDLAKASDAQMRRMRGSEIAMIFQEPMSSLNPLFTVGDQIAEMITLHERIDRAAAMHRVVELLETVEMPAAAKRVHDYPHQMSGGMRQRVMIAMALACRPRLLIADEPTTALDVTIQAQIIDLLKRLQSRYQMSILFITHNLGVVAEIADELVVMYAGQVVEKGPVASIFAQQRHPYTKGLLAATPNAALAATGDERRRLLAIPGSVPPVTAPRTGCVFAPRCGYVTPACRTTHPALVASGDGWTRCIRHEVLSHE